MLVMSDYNRVKPFPKRELILINEAQDVQNNNFCFFKYHYKI